MGFAELIDSINSQIHDANKKGLHAVYLLNMDLDAIPSVKEKLIQYYNDVQFGIDVHRCTKGTYDITIWW